MNCFNHTQEPAVAQCSDCGKGLCPVCAEMYKPILCTPCFQKRRRREIRQSLFSLTFLVVLFIIGFRLNFLAREGFENLRWQSGYVLLALPSGALLVERIFPYKMTAGTSWQWCFFYAFKLILYLIVGVFTAPFVFLWAVYRAIKAFR